jgi:hypothetical protein
MQGPFLIEVARKRQSGIPAIQRYVNGVWDTVKKQPGRWGASAGFRYSDRDEGGTYHRIQKFETSIVPRFFAANPYTASEVMQ